MAEKHDTMNHILTSLKLLCSAFGRKLDQDALAFWASRLSEYPPESVFKALREAMDGERFPTLKQLRDAAGNVGPTRNTVVEHPPLTADQRKRSDHSAIMSMLWLHYDKGWPLTDFGGHILGRLFGKDPHEALAKAKEIYDAPTVKAWMIDQQRAGN